MSYLKNPYILGGSLVVLGILVYILVDYFSNDTFKPEDLNADTGKGDNFSAKNMANTVKNTLDDWFGWDFSRLVIKLNSLNDAELEALYNKFNEKYGKDGTLYSRIQGITTYSTITETRKQLLLSRMSELGLT